MLNILLSIIIMATKSTRKLHLLPLRTSPRLPNSRILLLPTLLAVPTAIDSEQSHNQPSLLHASQEYKLKVDKQTPSPFTHSVAPPLPHPAEVFIPVIQHCPVQSTTILPGHHSPTFQQPTMPTSQMPPQTVTNINNGVSWSQIPGDLSYDPPVSLKRVCSRGSQTFSPFTSARKSYRKLQKRQIVSIPYRRCHDALQGRIIAIINKMINGRNCHKDIESLIEKISKISQKDMMNKYILGGIRTIIAMANDRNICEAKVLARLETQYKKMKEKIEGFLMNFEEFQCENESSSIDDEPFTENDYKNQVIRRIYNMNIKRFPQNDRQELKKKIIKECECCFNGELTLSGLVHFLRNKLEDK